MFLLCSFKDIHIGNVPNYGTWSIPQWLLKKIIFLFPVHDLDVFLILLLYRDWSLTWVLVHYLDKPFKLLLMNHQRALKSVDTHYLWVLWLFDRNHNIGKTCCKRSKYIFSITFEPGISFPLLLIYLSLPQTLAKYSLMIYLFITFQAHQTPFLMH